jgi:beta-lactamase class A
MNKKITPQKNQKQINVSIYFYLAIVLIVGIGIGYSLSFIKKGSKTIKTGQAVMDYSEIRSGGYEFTNPLLDCDNFQSSSYSNLVELQNSLNEYINTTVKNGNATQISVYFRSLNNGPWVGINENENYTPASLLKVPVMVAILKKAETDTAFLKKKILCDKSLETIENAPIDGNKFIVIGKSYTIDELLEYMIVQSDNRAKQILSGLLGDDYIKNVMTDMGVNLRTKDLTKDFLSVKEYSSFYRIMYNASYLNRKMSEKALEILSRTKFKRGIPNKLPKNIKIAHKFGIREFENPSTKQLHDCGIVYYPSSPYLLCIMTKGHDFDILVEIISDISEMVYNSVGKK